MRLDSVFLVLLAPAVVMVADPRGATAQPSEKPAYLVDVAAGETTSDTSPDQQSVEKRSSDASSERKPIGNGRTGRPSYGFSTGCQQPKPVVVDEPALGGQGMKVTFMAGGSIGQRTRLTEWTKFGRLRIRAVNPGTETALELNVVHAGSTNFATRVAVPLTIKPGRNEFLVEIGDLENTDGSPPDLAHVKRWYLAEVRGKTPTLVFYDIELEARATQKPARRAGQSQAATPGVTINRDRLTRIKAAKIPKFDRATPSTRPRPRRTKSSAS